MKALAIVERGKPEVVDLPMPEIGDDDILLQVKAAGICGGDTHQYYGDIEPTAYPRIAGHEGAGIIAAKGKNVSDYWQVGDRVATDNTYDACGRCECCAQGHFVACRNRVTLGFGADGVFAEYTKIPGRLLNMHPHCLMKLPDNVSFEEAVLLEAGSNCYKAMIQQAHMVPAENVVVYGMGALGLYCVQWAKLGGAANIISIGQESDKAIRFPIAEKLGATHLLSSNSGIDVEAEVAKIVGDAGLHIAVDAVGLSSIQNQCISMLNNEGRLVLIGNAQMDPLTVNLQMASGRNQLIIGHMGYDALSWRAAIRMAGLGKLDLKSIITHRLPIEQIKEGFQLVKEQKANKVVIVF